MPPLPGRVDRMGNRAIGQSGKCSGCNTMCNSCPTFNRQYPACCRQAISATHFFAAKKTLHRQRRRQARPKISTSTFPSEEEKRVWAPRSLNQQDGREQPVSDSKREVHTGPVHCWSVPEQSVVVVEPGSCSQRNRQQRRSRRRWSDQVDVHAQSTL